MVLFGIFAKRIFESMRTSWSYVINFYDYHTVFSQFSLQFQHWKFVEKQRLMTAALLKKVPITSQASERRLIDRARKPEVFEIPEGIS